MCKSVPQMDATLTLTRTSLRPKAGIFTSRTSAPGADAGLTTAIIEEGMSDTLRVPIRTQNISFYHCGTLGFAASMMHRSDSRNYYSPLQKRQNSKIFPIGFGTTQRATSDATTTPIPMPLKISRSMRLPLIRRFLRRRAVLFRDLLRRRSLLPRQCSIRLRRHALVILRLSPRDAEAFPFAGAQMFGQKHDLASVIGIVRDLPIDCLQDGVRFIPDGYGVHYVFRREGVDCGKDAIPSFFPQFHHVGSGGRAGPFEFLVAETIGLFAVCGEEIGETRTHVARHVLDEDGNRVGLRVDGDEEIFIFQLRHCRFRQALIAAHLAASFFEIVSCCGLRYFGGLLHRWLYFKPRE